MTNRNSPQVNILILNRNGLDLLKECIPSIENNTEYGNYEIVLIDNNSGDGSVEYVRNRFPDVHIHQNSENYGFAEAYNKAIKKCDSEYVVLLNNDTEVEHMWLEPLVSAVTTTKNTAIVSPKLIYENGDPQFLGDKVLLKESGVPNIVNSIIKKIESKFDQEKEIYRGIGAAMLIKKDLFEDIGYLDEDYEFYVEEFDFCLRAINANYSIRYTPQSKVIHKSRSSAGSNPYYSIYLRRKSRLRFYALNYSIPRLTFQVPFEIIAFMNCLIHGNQKWLMKSYFDFLVELPDLLELRNSRKQYHHTTNKIRTVKEQLGLD